MYADMQSALKEIYDRKKNGESFVSIGKSMGTCAGNIGRLHHQAVLLFDHPDDIRNHLSVRAMNCLRNVGLELPTSNSKARSIVRELVRSRMLPDIRKVRLMGRKTLAEICLWAGITYPIIETIVRKPSPYPKLLECNEP